MWELIEGRLVKRTGDIDYIIEFKPALESELDGRWYLYHSEMGLVMVELVNSKHLEKCINYVKKILEY